MLRCFCYKITIFDGCLSFEHFARNYEKTLRITNAQGENKYGDPTSLLQFFEYMADICAKFENNLDGTSFSSELP